MPNFSIRHDWNHSEIEALYENPLLDLVFEAASIHRYFHNPHQIQVCHLISVKTGGCPENCKYCTQSSHYQTSIKAEPQMKLAEVIERAKTAIDKGATRICLGAAIREARPGKQFDQFLEMIKEISSMGAEVCCTLGMLGPKEVDRLAAAGLFAYNHNLDTSRSYYKEIITTRTYDDRLKTLDNVEKGGISVCCGGIVGMGESVNDRMQLLHTLATRSKHPESVPINLLVPIEGTPLEKSPPVPFFDFLRLIAITRILMPKSMVRLSAGRMEMSTTEQAFCFLAGANSIHSGEKLLTAANPDFNDDDTMLTQLGLRKLEAYANLSN